MMKKIQATLVNVIRILGMFEAAAAVEAFRTTEKPPSSSSSSWSTLTWSHPMLRATHHHDQYEEDRHSNDNAPSHKDHEDTMPTTVVYDFQTDKTSWTGGYGAPFEVANGMFVSKNRTSRSQHSPTLDMVSFQDCLIPGQQYLFTAKIRLHDPNDKDGAFINSCSCVELQPCMTFTWTMSH